MGEEREKEKKCLNVLSMHGEVEEGWSVFKLVEHAWGGFKFRLDSMRWRSDPGLGP
jgi:hypothetical protein